MMNLFCFFAQCVPKITSGLFQWHGMRFAVQCLSFPLQEGPPGVDISRRACVMHPETKTS